MTDISRLALARTDDFPIRTQEPVHDGKVRSVYWLTDADSTRLIRERDLPVPEESPLGIMVISDRISAFDANWRSEHGLGGVPGKGASLNAVAQYWFQSLSEKAIGQHHILEVPHPLIWLVQKADAVKVEAIARQYITGSMWRKYEKGSRDFCGIQLPDHLQKNQRLDQLLLTPTTKGVLTGIPGVPEQDDVNVSMQQIRDNYAAFGFKSPEDVDYMNQMTQDAFAYIATKSAETGNLLVDTKFEFGYLPSRGGCRLGFIDEVATPDSSRFWSDISYADGSTRELSKEVFRQFLLEQPFGTTLLQEPVSERKKIAAHYEVPYEVFEQVGQVYRDLAEELTGDHIAVPLHPREEVMDALAGYQVLKQVGPVS